MKKKVVVSDAYQKNYVYYLVEKAGKSFHPEFKPELTPKQMLALGVFGGKYFSDQPKELPKDWFTKAKLSKNHKKDTELNFFKIDASQPLVVWQRNGWINNNDPRGWFQWYCRYYLGRRLPEEDLRQIKRWKAFRRHIGQIKNGCFKKDLSCRRKQRQALLHWAYDSRKI